MPNTYSNFTINDLTEFSFIAGDYQRIYFDVYSQTGSPLDITSASCMMVLSKYGDPTNVIGEFSGSPVVSGSVVNRYLVELNTEDTKNLSNKYTMQPVIYISSTVEYRPSQGTITIIPRIPREGE